MRLRPKVVLALVEALPQRMQAPANLACLIHEAAGNNAERDDQATLYCKLCSVLRKDKSVSNGEKWTAKRVTSQNSVCSVCWKRCNDGLIVVAAAAKATEDDKPASSSSRGDGADSVTENRIAAGIDALWSHGESKLKLQKVEIESLLEQAKKQDGPIIIMQQPGDVLYAPPGWGHFVLTLGGEVHPKFPDIQAAVTIVQWFTPPEARPLSIMQLVSAEHEHREAQLREYSTGRITNVELLQKLQSNMFNFAQEQGYEPRLVPRNPCRPALVAHGLDQLLEKMPQDRKTGTVGLHQLPSMQDLVGLLGKKELKDGTTLDVRFAYHDGQWKRVEELETTLKRKGIEQLQRDAITLGIRTDTTAHGETKKESKRIKLDNLTDAVVSKFDRTGSADTLFELLLGKVAFAANQKWTEEVVNPVADEHEKNESEPRGDTKRELNNTAVFSAFQDGNVTHKHAHIQGALNGLLSKGEKLWILWPPGKYAESFEDPRVRRWRQ